ncbi:uncharacterized protein SCODWIG_01004 [Saccharomycodes ludwigii]|uniref:GDP-mannose transporter n=1 Tax=Saccharomycodes ludwigii TaxID=36035 RepID=A0A376B3J0_9ASCO|nr:uncharacterized protein SCODWIG_01004 [Saccharomycodes ludwigii]
MFDPEKGLKLPYPIFITSIHQFLLWGFSWLYINVWYNKKYRNRNSVNSFALRNNNLDANMSIKGNNRFTNVTNYSNSNNTATTSNNNNNNNNSNNNNNNVGNNEMNNPQSIQTTIIKVEKEDKEALQKDTNANKSAITEEILEDEESPYMAQEDDRHIVTSNITWGHYFKYLVPTALASAGDIGFGNLSFKYVPLTIYTIVKSSSIAFVLIIGCLTGVEKFHWKLGTVVLLMFLGVVLMAFKPDNLTDTNDGFTIGVFLVLLSSMLSGLRWVYTQIILKKRDALKAVSFSSSSSSSPSSSSSSSTTNTTVTKITRRDKKENPIFTIYRLAPIMGGTLIITSLLFETPDFHKICEILFTLNTGKLTLRHFIKGCIMLAFPGIQVFFMTICEFGILQIAYVLTLSIAGILKELLTILISMILLDEHLNGLYNWLGMFIVLGDLCYYNWYRYTETKNTVDTINSSDNDDDGNYEIYNEPLYNEEVELISSARGIAMNNTREVFMDDGGV